MQAIDTNIVARFILGDDPVQSPIAERVVSEGVFVPVTVLLEAAWLLGSRYGQSPGDVAGALGDFIDLPSVEVLQPDLLAWALERSASGADIADMIHLVASEGADRFLTFDAGIAADAGSGAPLPVERPR